MAEGRKNSSILRLNRSCTESLCKYLSVRDLINLAVAIPQWGWILETNEAIAKSRIEIKDWVWYDGYMSELLLEIENIPFENEIGAIYHYKRFEDLHFVRYYGPHPPEPISIAVLTSRAANQTLFYLFDDTKQFVQKMKKEAHLCRKRYIEVEVREIDIKTARELGLRPKLLADAVVFIEGNACCLRDNLDFIIDNVHPKSMLCVCCVKNWRITKPTILILQDFLRRLGGVNTFDRIERKFDWHLFCIKNNRRSYENIPYVFRRICDHVIRKTGY